MTELLTSAQMRAVEAAAIATGRVTGPSLMERAGAGVVDAVLAKWPDLAGGPQRAVVLCGPGNNGGDGYVVARLLAARGWAVQVVAPTPPATPDARAMAARWTGPLPGPDAPDRTSLADRPLVVDALFGTGLSRPVAPGVWGLLALAQGCGCRLVAVDILSGICADSGRVLATGGYIDRAADLTVTFQHMKLGHVLADGAGLSGAIAVVPLGLDREIETLLRADDGQAVADLATPATALLGKEAGHKYRHGHALVLAGGVGHGGAARLAARGALRIGAGLVTLACPPAALLENAGRLDAVILRKLPDAAALTALLADARITALCLGPGLGLDRARRMVPAALAAGRPCVLDADALSAFAEDPAALLARLHDGCVLTPHGGEFARLFPDLAGRLDAPASHGPAFSKLDAARAAAARAGCTVLLKGADTVIATPDGRAAVSAACRDRAAPWLATAGAGDVLAGFLCGLLARGLPPFLAAETAAWLHVECARTFGPGLIAEDLPEHLPAVFRALAL
ncbi:NAD(P)H-hydrate dehydratase [Paracoccaceae bacterium Fryx2]|nr:NAD(P)H-hydrate dehydratase [Paracoccaceae bacterium Fryx2]